MEELAREPHIYEKRVVPCSIVGMEKAILASGVGVTGELGVDRTVMM